MTKLTRLALKFVVGFAAAFLALEGFSLVQGLLAAKRIHAITFPSEFQSLPMRNSDSVQPGQVLARRMIFKDTVDVVVSGNWILTLQVNNRLTGVDMRDRTVRDFSNVLASPQNPAIYAFMWRSQYEDKIFLGNLTQGFVQLLVTPEGLPIGLHSLERPSDFTYSQPTAGENWISDGYFRDSATTLAVSRLVGGRLTAGRNIKTPAFAGLPTFVSLEANRNSIAVKRDGQRVALAFWYAPYINVYDTSGVVVRSLKAPFKIDQKFGEQQEHGDVRMRHLPDTKLCYIDIAASDNLIVALFSGEGEGNYSAMQGDQLHIFSWDGQLIKNIHLDYPVSHIAEGPTDERIWAVRRGTDPAIIEYKLDVLAK